MGMRLILHDHLFFVSFMHVYNLLSLILCVIYVDGLDYIAINRTITFEIDETEIVVRTLIMDNSALEDLENFSVFIAPIAGIFPVAVKNHTAVVSITDDGELGTYYIEWYYNSLSA